MRKSRETLEMDIDAGLFDVLYTKAALFASLGDAPLALKEVKAFATHLANRSFIPQRYSGYRNLLCWDETLSDEEQKLIKELVATERSLKMDYQALARIIRNNELNRR